MPWGRDDNACTTFGRSAPQNFRGPKKRPNFGAISDNFRLWSRISPELINISNIWKEIFINHYPFHVGQKKMGELWSTIKKVLMAHSDQPKWTFFWRLHFGHYAVLPSRIFTLVTDWPRLPSPSPKGDGGLPKNFNRENLKLGLKFNVWTSITFGLVWVSPRKFSRRRAARQGW